MDTYDRIEMLMKQNGEIPSELSKATKISTGLLSQWKSRMQNPSLQKLSLVADHYNVTVDYLLGNVSDPHTRKATQKDIDTLLCRDDNDQLVNNDPELTAYLEELKNRKEMRMLFSLAAGATKEDVEKSVKIIEALLGKKADDE